jgi:hypothetical protein
MPPPEQKTEKRGTDIKIGPFVRAERGKEETAESKKGGERWEKKEEGEEAPY